MLALTSEPSSGNRVAPHESPRYRLVSRIATGGTAEIFLAVMPGACGAGKPVVIKRLWPELARDPECARMFLDEARLSLRLHHPNVIHGYESGHDGTHYYLTMEYLDGQSFKHLLGGLDSQGGLSLPLSLKTISDVLAGLEYVHGLTELDGTPMRIVHRDVSPQNVFISYNGVVKLIDFGIAQTAGTQDRSRLVGIEGRLPYMAPEQAAGEPIDQRADLFSVGIMLWEAVMGRRLWQGMSDAMIKERLLARRPIPRLPSTRGFPPALANICARALALAPAERYSNASEFQADLSTVLTGSIPIQSRLLGDTVSRLFSNQRTLVSAMIQQSLMPEGETPPLLRSIPAGTPNQTLSQAAPGIVVFDRSTAARFATLGDDDTAAGQTTHMYTPSSQRTVRLLGVVALSLVLGSGLALASRFLRQPTPSTSTLDRVPATPVVLPVLPTPEPEPSAIELAPSEGALPPQTAKARPRTRRHALLARRGSLVSAKTAVERPAAQPLTVQDFFEHPLHSTKRAPVQTIDREDPYGP
jgi:serine/threonine protein kinase